jgi:hypothetical protein
MGVLVGWTHRDVNGRLDLRLQSVQSAQHAGPEDAESHHFFMTRNQAAVLANYLMTISRQTPPVRRRLGFLGKLLGG